MSSENFFNQENGLDPVVENCPEGTVFLGKLILTYLGEKSLQGTFLPKWFPQIWFHKYLGAP